MKAQSTKIISNKDFEEYFNNKEYQKIMNKAGAYYYRLIGDNRFAQAKRIALWKTMLSHDENKGSKFTTSLYIRSIWQFKQELDFSAKETSVRTKKGNYTNISTLLLDFTDEEQQLLYDIYVYEKSDHKIAKENGLKISDFLTKKKQLMEKIDGN